MSNLKGLLEKMHNNPRGVLYADLCKVCDYYFGQARQTSGSHRVYKTLWSGDPRVNIQNSKGHAKAYQVRQILRAIRRLEVEHDTKK